MIQPTENQPLNTLILAINHYISTGDYLGQGFAMETPDGDFMVLLTVNVHMEQDKQDFEAFKAKFDEISGDFNTKLDDQGPDGLFHHYSFNIAPDRVEEMAAALVESPGPLGWGSVKKLIDKLSPPNGRDQRGMTGCVTLFL